MLPKACRAVYCKVDVACKGEADVQDLKRGEFQERSVAITEAKIWVSQTEGNLLASVLRQMTVYLVREPCQGLDGRLAQMLNRRSEGTG